MSPVPAGLNNGHGVNYLGGNVNVVLQLITLAQLLHFIVPSLQSRIVGRRRAATNVPSLVLGVSTLCVLIAYVLRIRPLEGDVHFLTLTSRTPHPLAEEKEDVYPIYGWMYNSALICIFASAFLQLQWLARTSGDRGKTSALGDVRAGGGRHALTNSHRRDSPWTPEWVVVTIGLAGAVALAGMRCPLLEVFLGGDFDKNNQLSGMSTVVAFLLVLWRGTAFLDIISTIISLGESNEKDTIVLSLWQRASLPMAAELTFDILSILLYESVTFKTFSRDEVGHATAGIRVFDSPVAIALSALSVTLAKLLKERYDHSSSLASPSSSSTSNSTTESSTASLLSPFSHPTSPLPLSPFKH